MHKAITMCNKLKYISKKPPIISIKQRNMKEAQNNIIRRLKVTSGRLNFTLKENNRKVKTYQRMAKEAMNKMKMYSKFAQEAKEKGELRLKWARECLEKIN